MCKKERISGSDGVGVELCVLRVALRTGGSDRAVNDNMGDMDTLWRQLTRHALGQATQRKLAHRKRGRLRVPLDPGRGTREEHGTVPGRQHPAHGLLGDAKSSDCRHVNRTRDSVGINLNESASNTLAGVVNNNVR